MTDLDLRTLERDAEATADPALWRRYYAELRRRGPGPPSGEAVWEAELPGRVTNLVVEVGASFEDRLTAEEEWKRCGTGLGIEVRGADGKAAITFQWAEALQMPQGLPITPSFVTVGKDIRASYEHPCGLCRGSGTIGDGFADGPTMTCLTCGGTGKVYPRDPLDLGPRCTIRGPEFLGRVVLLCERRRSGGEVTIAGGSGTRLGPIGSVTINLPEASPARTYDIRVHSQEPIRVEDQPQPIVPGENFTVVPGENFTVSVRYPGSSERHLVTGLVSRWTTCGARCAGGVIGEDPLDRPEGQALRPDAGHGRGLRAHALEHDPQGRRVAALRGQWSGQHPERRSLGRGLDQWVG